MRQSCLGFVLLFYISSLLLCYCRTNHDLSCKVEGVDAFCHVDEVFGSFNATINVTRCGKPPDLSLFVWSIAPNMSWNYTFMPDNGFEIHDVMTSDKFGKLSIGVEITTIDNVTLGGVIRYMWETEWIQLLSMNISIGPPYCGSDVIIPESPTAILVIGCASVICIIFALGLFRLHVQQRRNARGMLLDDAGTGLPGATPYMAGAAGDESPTKIKLSRTSLRISSTVIENDHAIQENGKLITTEV